MNMSLRIKEETMKKVVSASEAELEVMEKLWDHEGAIKPSQLLALFEEDGKAWKRQTLNTFLSRLDDKGLVKRENRLVKPLYGREEYYSIQMKALLDRMYGGKTSKSILIIDTPKCCEECPLELDVDGKVGANLCRGCEKYSYNPDSKKKPEWCPLKEMTEENV